MKILLSIYVFIAILLLMYLLTHSHVEDDEGNIIENDIVRIITSVVVSILWLPILVVELIRKGLE